VTVIWHPRRLTLPRVGILRDARPALAWFEVGARDSDESALLVEFRLPSWWPLRKAGR
jgi:hypothetical protein